MNTRGFIEIQGGALEYRWLQGSKGLPTLVLLHEGLGCADLWKKFPEKLQTLTKSSVFVYSRFGYGGSDGCQLPRPVSYMHEEAGNLSTILSHVPGSQFILVGHSDGASIATIHAAENTDASIQGLVLLAPHFFVEEMTLESIAKIKMTFESTDFRQRLMRYHGEQVDSVFGGWIDIWLNPEFKSWNICDSLTNVTIPILILQGDDDEYGSGAQIDAARKYASGPVGYLYYCGCGHSPQIRYEDEVSEEINNFVQALQIS